MIKDCSNILECEKKLYSKLEDLGMLSEVELSSNDVDKLSFFIREQISQNIEIGTEFLKTRAKTCLACLLVWKGIYGYKEGDYWSAIEESTGLRDVNWKVEWGRIFLNFLESNDLPVFDIKDSHRYVTNILLHGMIPNSCLGEYFERVLIPFHKDLVDPTDRKEISFFLENRRRYNDERILIEEWIAKLERENHSKREYRRWNRDLIMMWDDREKIERLEADAGDLHRLSSLPESSNDFIDKKKSEIDTIEKEIKKLENKQQCEREERIFSQQDKMVLDNSRQIIGCGNILPELGKRIQRAKELEEEEKVAKEDLRKHFESLSSEAWDEEYGKIITDLPLEELNQKIEQFCLAKVTEARTIHQISLKKVWSMIILWASSILSFLVTSIRKEDKRINDEIKEMLKDLPIKPELLEIPGMELVQRLTLMRKIYGKHCKLSENRQSLDEENLRDVNKIKRLAEMEGVNVTSNVDQMISDMQNKLALAVRHKESAKQAEQEIKRLSIRLKELDDEKESITEELEEVHKRLARLGDGNIQLGIERLKQRRASLNEANSIRSGLENQYPHLFMLERLKNKIQQEGKGKEECQSQIGRLDNKMEQIENEISRLEKNLDLIPLPFPYVDKPVQRFLIYGGETSRDFLAQSVEMVNRTIAEKELPSVDEIRLPQRVLERFARWWIEYEKTEKDTVTDHRTLQERFRSPVIFLDTIDGIKVKVPPQRFSLHGKIDIIRLVTNEGKPDSRKEVLRVYEDKERLFETGEIDFPLPCPSDLYEFRLKNGKKTIKSWDPIAGVCIDPPFMAFHYDSRKLIQGTELPKGMVWIVLHKRYGLEPSQAIRKKASLYGKWREYNFLALDLTDVTLLHLLSESGKDYSITVSEKQIFEPIIRGGKILSGCHSGGEDIYIEKPPNVIIPMESADEMKRWTISLFGNGQSTLADSRHYALTDFQNILNIDTNMNICEFSLSEEKCLGEHPVGRFTVRLKNEVRNIDTQFYFCVVPHIKLKFAKEIYLPSEEGNSKVYLTLQSSEKLKFEPRAPAKKIDQKNHIYKIETDANENSVYGTLQYFFSKEDFIPIPMAMQIPRLTCRIEGIDGEDYSSECNIIEEIWIGDLEKADESLSLIVQMPPFVKGDCQLRLGNSDQWVRKRLQEGKTRFDLRQFSTTLQSRPDPLQSFELTVFDPDLSLKDVELFRVRTKWEVVGIECIQRFDDRRVDLKISWKKELGKPEGQRVMRLWKIDEPDSDPVTIQIPEGAMSIEVSEQTRNLRPGRYRVHIDIDDPWSHPFIPEEKSLNTIDILIQEKILQRDINISSVVGRSKPWKLITIYSIQVEGKIIGGKLPDRIGGPDVLVKEETNEGWYVGNIAALGDCLLTTEIDQVNPVKFEYDPYDNSLRAIEDINGEGVYFCHLCKELFWGIAAYEKEKRRFHEKSLLTTENDIVFSIEYVDHQSQEFENAP